MVSEGFAGEGTSQQRPAKEGRSFAMHAADLSLIVGTSDSPSSTLGVIPEPGETSEHHCVWPKIIKKREKMA